MDGRILYPPSSVLDPVLQGLACQSSLPAFEARLLDCGRTLGDLVRKDAEARRYPEIQAFGFWMRSKALERLAQRARALAPPEGVLKPRGLVFHLPPGNVPTLFAYCWLLAFLAGNRNVVRLSERRGIQDDVLLCLIGQALDDFPELRARQLFLSYGHDDDITARISSISDLRLIWGGDETVRHIRAIALPPLAEDLCFGDRFSLAAFSASAVAALSDADLAALAERFCTDVFSFDQMACSSPRLLVWTGEPGLCDRAAARFYPALVAAAAARKIEYEAGVVCDKLTVAYRAILDAPVSQCTTYGGRLTVLSLSTVFDVRDRTFGAGTLFELRLPDLAALGPALRRKDQTLVHFGFPAETLSALALNAAGLDRLVPVGQALAFGEVWDGHDLLAAVLRPVTLLGSA